MEPVDHIMQFFAFEHLPPHLREVSEPFAKGEACGPCESRNGEEYADEVARG